MMDEEGFRLQARNENGEQINKHSIPSIVTKNADEQSFVVKSKVLEFGFLNENRDDAE